MIHRHNRASSRRTIDRRHALTAALTALRAGGLGQRWRVRRPILVGPTLDPVLRRALRPRVVHHRAVHLGPTRTVVDASRSTSIHPTRTERHTIRTIAPSPIRRPRGSAAPADTTTRRRELVLRTGAEHRIDVVRRRSRSAVVGVAPVPPAVRPAATSLQRHDPTFRRPGVMTSATVPCAYAPMPRPTPGAVERSGRPGHSPSAPAPEPTASAPAIDRQAATPAAAVDVDDLTRRVVDAIDRRLISHRERMGRR